MSSQRQPQEQATRRNARRPLQEASDTATTEQLLPTTSTSPYTPASTATENGPQKGQSSSTAPKTLRHQPKSSARRTREEREAQRLAFEKAKLTRIAPETSNSSSPPRGGLQYRGAAYSQGYFRRSGPAAGHLGSHTVEDEAARRQRTGRGGFVGNSTRPSAKPDSPKLKSEPDLTRGPDIDGDISMGEISSGVQASKGPGPNTKKPRMAPVLLSSDEDLDPSKRRMADIEEINLISDEDTDKENTSLSNVRKGKQPEREAKIPNWGRKPIRISRQDHIDKGVRINTDASSKQSEELRRQAQKRGEAQGSLFLSDDDEDQSSKRGKTSGVVAQGDKVLKQETTWQGVYDDEDLDDSKLKKESTDEDVIIVDERTVPSTQPAAPKSVSIDKVASPRISTRRKSVEISDDDEGPAPSPKRRRKRHHRHEDTMQTEEEEEERSRYEEDLRFLSKHLMSLRISTSKAPEKDDNLDMEDGEHNKDVKENNVLLFQLPPILPRLDDPSSQHFINTPEQLEQSQAGPETSETKAKRASAPEKQGTDIKLELPQSPDVKVKTEFKTEADTHTPETLEKAFLHRDSAMAPGRIGKLRCYETGSIILDWGGAKLEVGRGSLPTIYQEAVMTDCQIAAENGEQGSNSETSCALGRLDTSYILTPEFSSFFKGI